MNQVYRQQIIGQAHHYWITDQTLETGKIIFESIPLENRPQWAAEILEFAYLQFSPLPEIDAVLEFAKHSDKWDRGENGNHYDAHRLVDAVNHRSSSILVLATQVGKVVYTAQQYPAPFDHRAGWKIAEALKRIVKEIDTVEFEQQAWAQLCNEHFIQLEQPVMCHPGCPMCEVNGLIPSNHLQD